MLRRSRVNTTEERELLPLHRPSTSLSLSVGSSARPSNQPQPQQPLSAQPPAPPPPRRRSSTTTTPSPTAIYGYKRRETPHDAALADLNTRLAGNSPHSAARAGGGAPTTTTTTSTIDRGLSGDTNNGGRARQTSISSTQTATIAPTKRSARHLSLPPPPRPTPTPSMGGGITYYDPYTGQYRGQLLPSTPSATSDSSSSSDSDTDPVLLTPPPDLHTLLSPEEQARERDMWETLARIRAIQSEVARKQMKLGAEGGTGGGGISPRGSMSRKSGRDSAAVLKDDSAEVSTGVTQPQDAFAQRREAIDEIVKKLDDLSTAVKQLNKPPPTFTSTTSHPPTTTPRLHIPNPPTTTNSHSKPSGGGWRSPSTSSYNSFVEEYSKRNGIRMGRSATTVPAVYSSSSGGERGFQRGVVYESPAEY